MKRGHIPIRMCMGCRQKKRQAEMIRLMLDLDGKMTLDGEKGRVGRGYYLCPDLACFVLARKKSRIGQLLERNGLMISLKARFLNEGSK